MPLSPYDISSIYAEMEIDLAKSMKRNLKGHEIEEIKEGFKWEQWQKAKLRDIKKFQKRNKKIIKKYQSLIDGEVDTLFDDTYKSSTEKSEGFFARLKGKIKGIFSREPQEEDFFKANEDKVFNLIKSVKGDLHNANSAALRQMDDVYRKTLFKANMYVANGASTVNQAVDMATKDFLLQGIRCIEYKNGRRVDIASYSEMAIRTANQRITLMADGVVRDKHGIHTVLAPAHGNTCPLCLAWQGKILIDDVYSSGKASEGNYPLLSTAMKEGFLHPNCRHHPTTFIPGINSIPKEQTEEEKQEALDKYNAEQKQRYYERKIRKYKRLEAGSCDERNSEKYKQKVSEYQLELQKHLSENKFLRRDTWREKLRNYNSNSPNSSIIKERNDKANNFSTNRELINSEEYKEKFNNIGSKKQNEVVCKETKNAIKKNDGSNTEMLSIIDSKGNVVFNQKTGSFGGSIDLSKIEKMANNSVVLTHNHPMSTSFSGDDLALIIDNPQIKTIIAGGHDGTVYKLSIGKGVRTEINNLTGRNSIIQEYQEMLRNGLVPNEIVQILSDKYKWKYEVI